jgi:hypothetical protein
MSLPNEDNRPRPLNGLAPMTVSGWGMAPTIRRTPALRLAAVAALHGLAKPYSVRCTRPAAFPLLASPDRSGSRKTLQNGRCPSRCIHPVCTKVQVHDSIYILMYSHREGVIPQQTGFRRSVSNYVWVCQILPPSALIPLRRQWRRRRPRT